MGRFAVPIAPTNFFPDNAAGNRTPFKLEVMINAEVLVEAGKRGQPPLNCPVREFRIPSMERPSLQPC